MTGAMRFNVVLNPGLGQTPEWSDRARVLDQAYHELKG